MNIIDDFMEHYSREMDFFAELARIVQRRIEASFASHGIRAMVTSRAKSLVRLGEKLEKRQQKRAYIRHEPPYGSLNDIYEDIIDLAGVRIALYFPADRARVAPILAELFNIQGKPKDFPEPNRERPGKRFSGYVATHYLVRLKISSASEDRYADTTVEVQVASVLMHAWAEVEHDLEYKPETGKPSEDESAILDEINGLVQAGEIALERLQRAIERRTSKDGQKFRDQFDVASFLRQHAVKFGFPVDDIGKVDALVSVLRYLDQDSPSKLGKYLSELGTEDKSVPVADVILDKVLEVTPQKDKEKVTGLVSAALLNRSFERSPRDKEATHAIGYFLNQWIYLETALKRVFGSERPLRDAIRQSELPDELKASIDSLRSYRNKVVHGYLSPDSAFLNSLAEQIRQAILPALYKWSGVTPVGIRRKRRSRESIRVKQ